MHLHVQVRKMSNITDQLFQPAMKEKNSPKAIKTAG